MSEGQQCHLEDATVKDISPSKASAMSVSVSVHFSFSHRSKCSEGGGHKNPIERSFQNGWSRKHSQRQVKFNLRTSLSVLSQLVKIQDQS